MNEVDLHALSLLLQQYLGKPLTHLVIVQYVGLQIDVILGRQDGCQHGSVGSRAILKQNNLVASGQRTARNGFLERQVAIKYVGFLATAGQAFQDLLALQYR